MKPEEIDKIFGERLKNAAPTPPADLWNRLQERMEAELPQQEQKVKPIGFFMWVNKYAAAAAVTLMLSVGGTLYMLQEEKSGKVEGLAQTDVKQAAPTALPSEKADAVAFPAATDKPAGSLANVPKANAQEPQLSAEAPVLVAEPQHVPATAKARIAKATPKRQATKSLETTAEPQPEQLSTLALLNNKEEETAAGTSSAPLEIIIKRASEPVAFASETYTEEAYAAEEGTGFDKKRRLAKNILKQVVNLSNGERVELSELGINANKIALETQIGKQKISKVIHL